ncbi:MAG: hypothetical protein CTY13_02605 [Methylobacter sp.]|nr:MAG: hypothetical protein CTY13_02605 [Methylobacter sp.]
MLVLRSNLRGIATGILYGRGSIQCWPVCTGIAELLILQFKMYRQKYRQMFNAASYFILNAWLSFA